MPEYQTKKPRTDIFTMVVHWLLVIALVVAVLTGLRIAYDEPESILNGLAISAYAILPAGAVIDWHIYCSWLLVALIIAYTVFMVASKQGARITFTSAGFKRIGKALTKGPKELVGWQAANALLYQVAFLLVLTMAVTGVMMYSGTSVGLAPIVTLIHGVSAALFILYIVLHVVAQLFRGDFMKIFRPRMAYTGAAIAAVVASLVLVAGVYRYDSTAQTELKVAHVGDAPSLDGLPDDPVWNNAKSVRIETWRAANVEDGRVPVTVSAVRDDQRAYFMFQWPDKNRSQKHLPLVKTDEGWKVMQSEFEINDEDVYYEDKFSVVLSEIPALGSGTVHLGQNLIEGPHRPTNRGLHYTSDGSLADMWHWKGVRTGGMTPALIDDNYFGPPLESSKEGKRYKGGYSTDPKDEGGYELNYNKLDKDVPLAESRILPKFLPLKKSLIESIQGASLEADSNDEGRWYLYEEEVQPYDEAKDDYPIGTIMPGVIIKGTFTGDRGDLFAGANWKDGMWTLEVSREFDTGSKYDVALNGDKDVYLWVAAFNHTQTRHSQHLHPVKISFE